MNKKGIIAIIVIAVIVIIGFSLSKNSANAPVSSNGTTGTSTTVVGSSTTNAPVLAPVTKNSTDSTLLAKLKKASVGVSEDGTSVALSNGTASFVISGSSAKGTVTLGDVAIEKAKGTRNDVVTTVAVNNGGVSTNTYVVLFEDKGVAGLDDKSYSLIGDGVKVTGIRADEVSDSSVDYIVSVSYTDSSSKAHTKILVVESGMFNSAKEINL